jgi:hypothetical protein
MPLPQRHKRAKTNFQKALEVDPTNLFARQGEAWLEAGLLEDASRRGTLN